MIVLLALGLAVGAVALAARAGRERGRVGSIGVALGAVAVAAVLMFGLTGAREPQTDAATVKLVGPLDDTTVSNPVTIEVVVERAQQSHPHVMVDEPCVDEGEVIPADSAHLHLGGERKWTLDLPPGPHTMCAQMGDRQHRAAAGDDRIDFVVK